MAAELPQEGWYRDPVDPTRRRWWDGKEWSTIVAPTVNPEAAAPARPTMADGTTLPYADRTVDEDEPVDTDDGKGRSRPSRVRVLQMAVALVAIVATAGVVFVGRDEAPEGPVDVPITTEAPAATTEPAPTTTEAPAAEPEPAAATEAPPYRDAYLACQEILEGSSLGDGGLDLQPLRDTDAEVVGPVTELRFEATDADGVTETYLCRTLFDGDGNVMVGRLYLDLQNVLGG